MYERERSTIGYLSNSLGSPEHDDEDCMTRGRPTEHCLSVAGSAELTQHVKTVTDGPSSRWVPYSTVPGPTKVGNECRENTGQPGQANYLSVFITQ